MFFPGAPGVDGCAFDRSGEFNWVVPQTYLIWEAIKHFC